MNWWYAIPAIGLIVLLFVDPMADFVMIIAVPLITGAAFLFEKVFGPRQK